MAIESTERFVGENFMRDILAKDPEVVTEDERDILRARRSYLTRGEVERFGLDEVKKVFKPAEAPKEEIKTVKGKK